MGDNRLNIVFEWESPQQARGPELRATWARLSMSVAHNYLTRVEDRVAKSTREAIYLPLYPLAEWVTTNWWALLNEVTSPNRASTSDYTRRHDLLTAAEGYAVPHLRIQPEGSLVRFIWSPLDVPENNIRFLSGGSTLLDRTELVESLSRFITAVVTRLSDQGVTHSLLAEEWSAIQTADDTERQFCTIAGQLGCDPYALDEEDRQAILTAADSLSPSLGEEFFYAAAIEELVDQSKAVKSFVDESADSDIDMRQLVRLRSSLEVGGDGAFPWDHGYKIAQELRRQLECESESIPSVEKLGDLLRVDANQWEQAIAYWPEHVTFLDAIFASSKSGSPRFGIRHRASKSRCFALCRALCEFLISPPSSSALITPTHSDRQKRNRAFAAEFLAPARQLGKQITGPVIGEEEIDVLAEEFGVSTFVVRHQIQNHKLGRLEGW